MGAAVALIEGFMTTFWIATSTKFRRHASAHSAELEREHLQAEYPKARWRVLRVSTTIRETNYLRLIARLTGALKTLVDWFDDRPNTPGISDFIEGPRTALHHAEIFQKRADARHNLGIAQWQAENMMMKALIARLIYRKDKHLTPDELRALSKIDAKAAVMIGEEQGTEF